MAREVTHADSVEGMTERRGSAFTLLFRRTPFTFLLRGCRLDDIRAADPVLPRQFRLTTSDGVLLLRYWGGAGSTRGR